MDAMTILLGLLALSILLMPVWFWLDSRASRSRRQMRAHRARQRRAAAFYRRVWS